MKIQALEIQRGDRIIAYCYNKMQSCTVQRVLDYSPDNITLSVSTSVRYRRSTSCVVRFHQNALVEMAG